MEILSEASIALVSGLRAKSSPLTSGFSPLLIFPVPLFVVLCLVEQEMRADRGRRVATGEHTIHAYTESHPAASGFSERGKNPAEETSTIGSRRGTVRP